MKKTTLALLLSVFFFTGMAAQSLSSVKGKIVDSESQEPLADVLVKVSGTTLTTQTNEDGIFFLGNVPVGDQVLELSLNGYETQNFPVKIEEGKQLGLETIFLFVDLSTIEEDSGLISLTEDDLNDDDGRAENTAGLLQASRDVFQNRAAFDFGQAFFRIRGYDSQNATVLMNGLPMNKLFNGRPQWNNWGGLNDVTRNQELATGLTPSNYTFGGILGTTNINTRASGYRPGLRVSGSYSNRTYGGRGMVTYSSGLNEKGLAYTISASRRWAEEGFIDGTLYDAFSFFGALEYRLNDNHSLNATAMFSPNRRGSSTAITERTFNALGREYNPYWGIQDGEIRNSRVREIEEPIFMLSHFYETERTTLTTNVAYQFGKQGRSRLDFANAYNPTPNYWRNLPFITENPQIDWLSLYEANLNTTNLPDAGTARYMLYEDRSDDDLFTINSILNTKIDDNLTLDLGATYRNLTSENFATPIDLLGADRYADLNLFNNVNGAPARNDLEGEVNKGVGDRIKYNYDINSNQFNSFAQLQFNYDKVDFFVSGSYTNTSYQRDGKFVNQLFENNSFGKGEKLTFDDFGIKGGLTYKITGRHLLQLNAGYLTQAPTIRNSFANSRENHNIVPNLTSEKITSLEASYIIRSSKLKARLTGYLTDFKEGTDVNFFFAESQSLGDNFFQELVTDVDKRHLGGELGLEYQISPTVKVSAVAAVGQHSYTDNAQVFFSSDEVEVPQPLGTTYIKDYKVANGPQQAYSLGLEYRSPKFWWVSATANNLSNTYVDIATFTRTEGFFQDNRGQLLPNIDQDLAREILRQEKFGNFNLINLAGGKSWRIKGKYISVFASINNLFDETFRTGGYEQARSGNYTRLAEEFALGVNRDFGNRHWYGFGRTYFINFAVSF